MYRYNVNVKPPDPEGEVMSERPMMLVFADGKPQYERPVTDEEWEIMQEDLKEDEKEKDD